MYILFQNVNEDVRVSFFSVSIFAISLSFTSIKLFGDDREVNPCVWLIYPFIKGPALE